MNREHEVDDTKYDIPLFVSYIITVTVLTLPRVDADIQLSFSLTFIPILRSHR